MAFIRLIYASRARENLHIKELMQIRKQSKVYNAAHGVTGILCYGHGAFLQLLEGTRENVNALYSHILRDPRHSHAEIISYVSTSKREFGEWAMKMVSIDEPFAAHRRAVLASYSNKAGFNPLTISKKHALGLLRELANVEREHVASLDDRVTQDIVPPQTFADELRQMIAARG